MAKPAGTIKVRIEADDETRADMRQIAREEIASLCGLVLRRISATYDEVEAMHGYDHRAYQVLKSVFGEALRDFSQTPDEPGPKDAA